MMEKRSEYYLTREARDQIYQQPWSTNDRLDLRSVAQAAAWHAEARKFKLVDLAKLEEKRGLLASLKRTWANFDISAHDLVFRANAWFTDNSDNAQTVNQIVQADLGKV